MRGVSISRLSAETIRDVLLVCLTFASGAVDAFSLLGLGRVFTALMSGNVILLGLAAGSSAGSRALRSAVALVVYAVAVFAATRFMRNRGNPRLWPPAMTVVLVWEAVAQAGLLAGWVGASGHPNAAFEVILVGVSAFAMGLQAGAVARLGVAGVTTTYVTGTLTRLIGELALGSGKHREIVRWGSVLGALLFGALCSALLMSGARQVAPALPLAITLLVIGVAVWRLRGKPGDAEPLSAEVLASAEQPGS